MHNKIIVWTATTEGDNCPLTSTVHVCEKFARQRVIDDMIASGRGPLSDVSNDTFALAQAWGNRMDGGCIIERHELEFAALSVAA